MRIRMKSSKLPWCLCAITLWLTGGRVLAQYTIGGVVTDSTNGTTFFGVSGVTVTAKEGIINPTGPSAVTDVNGAYTITDIDRLVEYNVSPAKTGLTFSPAGLDVEITSTSPTAVDFSVAHSISGQITVGGTRLSGSPARRAASRPPRT